MRRMFDDAALSAGYLRTRAGGRKDVVRHGDSVYCRRCGHLQHERDGAWRRFRMGNGVMTLQFICSDCGTKRDQALRALGQRR